MKKIAIGVVLTGGALLGLRRAMQHGRRLCDHCDAWPARCCDPDQAATTAV